MSVKTRTRNRHTIRGESTPREDVLSLALTLSLTDQNWLMEQLARLAPLEDDDDDQLPESATFSEAIDLFLADKCSLGRAAELAGVTRWHLQDMLYERGTPASLGFWRCRKLTIWLTWWRRDIAIVSDAGS